MFHEEENNEIPYHASNIAICLYRIVRSEIYSFSSIGKIAGKLETVHLGVQGKM